MNTDRTIKFQKEDPIILRIEAKTPSKLKKLLASMKLTKLSREFKISPCVLGISSQISGIMLSLTSGDGDVTSLPSTYSLMAQRKEQFVEILSLAIWNRKGKPDASLLNYLLHNLTLEELHSAIQVVLHQMRTGSFMQTINLMKGLNILPSSPEENGTEN